MLEKLYEAIYKRIGGRPWTYITRDESKKAPLLFMLIFLGVGIILVKFSSAHWWKIFIGLLVGVIVGHIWW